MCSEPAASNEFMLYLHRAKMTNLVSWQGAWEVHHMQVMACNS